MSFLVKISPEQKRLLELQYTIYTDGSCDHKNKGGWAAVIIDNKQKKTILSGFTPSSTNNRMELTAIIEALEWVLNKYDEKTKPYVKICLYSDSRYSINSIRDWISEWEKNDYKINDTTERPNTDLLKKLSHLNKQCQLDAKWVGRNSCENSKKADEICKLARVEGN
jgi:ribonuclease HI